MFERWSKVVGTKDSKLGARTCEFVLTSEMGSVILLQGESVEGPREQPVQRQAAMREQDGKMGFEVEQTCIPNIHSCQSPSECLSQVT